MGAYQTAYRMGHFNDGRANNPGGGNEDGRGGKRVREYPVVIRSGPSGMRIEDAGCIERIAPTYDRCGEPLAADSGAFCDVHKIDVRKSV